MSKDSRKILLLFLCFFSGVFLFLLGPLWAQEASDSPLQASVASPEKKDFLEPEETPAAMVNSVGEEALSSESAVSEDGLVSVNFENVDIRDVVRILAEKSQMNMVVGPEVAATVNLQLNNIPWKKALDVILTTYNLTYKRDGDLIRIMTLEQLQTEDEKIPLSTKIITLNFARAGEVKNNFGSMLSSRGKIEVNDRTNSMIITDLPDRIANIEEIANRLDTRTPQVMIEALMADVVIAQDDQLGINWQLDQEMHGPDVSGPKRSLVQNLGDLGPPGGIITFGTTLLTDKDLHATIAMYQRQSRVNILAHPQILTLDNLPAKINLTEEIPYTQVTQSTESSSAISSVAFKSAGINLQVTPHITTKDNYIYMAISVNQSFRSGYVPGGTQPIIDSRAAETNLLVKNRQTAVIGGLRRKNDSFAVSKLPLLGDIPFFGAIFRQRVGGLTDTDLLVFVTPTVVEERPFTPKENDRLQLFEETEKDWETEFNQMKKKKITRGTATASEQETKNAEAKKGEEGKPADYFYLRPPSLNN
ncbi:MAG TPA: secretin and TonB N-terminal domain-containing protein [Candidatus Omnitrophota bacterium]|nr:secretin and TonB N-terminal domain-containing protein [Candidatus Omnitrophota bacterium]HPD84003.1 secretin and TonB N-terminal domain-containing protein [Candidatus Omnitrophota bacterium]HRZ02860.1 secretin and TonB N-terminal domain-containing protein [Candidatus Omnitrophota bacterium]